MKSTSQFIAISDLLAIGRPHSKIIFNSDIKTKTWGDFIGKVTSLSHYLGKSQENRWALYCQHPFAFSMGFFSLLHAHKIIVLPPNMQEGTLEELRSQFYGIISDVPIPVKGVPAICPEEFTTSPPIGYETLSNQEPQIEFYTSGSTGTRKVVKKALIQLENEVAVLQSMWGERLGDGMVFSTVVHQHIYGLLFQILWPLSAGRSIWNDTITNPEILVQCLEKSLNTVLVSSPSYLERFPGLVDLSRLRNSRCTIFSSGGPLKSHTADRLKDTIGEAPLEVFGSTETGGIGWRCQEGGGHQDEWTPLKRVEVKTSSKNSALMVRSPFVSSRKNRWYEVGDSVVLRYTGGFILEGRKDRILKLGEKRLSLDDMESRLLSDPMVMSCSVISLLVDDVKKRPVLGAAIAPSKKGRLSLYKDGRRTFTKALEKMLLKFFEPVMIPKRWRYVDKLPEDAQGKRQRGQLEQLFNKGYHSGVTELFILKETRKEGAIKLGMMVPENLRYFDGHFPSTPIVPGIVQINWVMTYARKYFTLPSSIRSMEAVKFQELIFPGDILAMKLNWKPDKGKLLYTLGSKDKTFSSGRVVFAQGAS